MITFDSIHETFMTFSADDGLEAGMVCKITDNCAVGPCQSGDSFCGVARSARLGMAGIVLSGYVTLPFSGTAPTLGYCALCADGTGAVKVGGDRQYLVAHVDKNAQTVGLFL